MIPDVVTTDLIKEHSPNLKLSLLLHNLSGNKHYANTGNEEKPLLKTAMCIQVNSY